jgi:hypothetical protein
MLINFNLLAFLFRRATIPQEYSEQAGSKGPGSHIKHKAMKKLVALVDRSLDLFEGSLADDVFEGLISQVGMENGEGVWELFLTKFF